MSKPKEKWLRPTLKTNKPVVLIDQDGVLCDWDKRKAELLAQGYKDHELHQLKGGFDDLELIPGAKETWDWMQPFFDTYICSTPPWSNPHMYMEKRRWCEKYLGPSAKKKLILTHHKGLVHGDILIDDRIANGVADFKGRFMHFGSPAFPNWNIIKDHLEMYLTYIDNANTSVLDHQTLKFKQVITFPTY